MVDGADDNSLVMIVDTGVANIASLQAAFHRLKYQTTLVDDATCIEQAEKLVLPGVGSFGVAMQKLNDKQLVTPIRDRIEAGKQTLAVCLGLQLLCKSSEESPGIEGIGVLPVTVKRFSDNVQVPQLGWNEVQFDSDLVNAGDAYFANSYRIEEPPAGWTVARTNYDGQFISAVARKNVLACQFHPELSGRWGAALLQRWLSGSFASKGLAC